MHLLRTRGNSVRVRNQQGTSFAGGMDLEMQLRRRDTQDSLTVRNQSAFTISVVDPEMQLRRKDTQESISSTAGIKLLNTSSSQAAASTAIPGVPMITVASVDEANSPSILSDGLAPGGSTSPVCINIKTVLCCISPVQYNVRNVFIFALCLCICFAPLRFAR